MIPIFYIEEAGAKGLLPLSPAPQIPADPASASLRTISLDDSEHLLHNHHASVASLRLLFTFAPESMFAFTGIPNQPRDSHLDKQSAQSPHVAGVKSLPALWPQ